MWLRLLEILVIFIIIPSFGGTSFVCPLDMKLCNCTHQEATQFDVECEKVIVLIKQDEFLIVQCRNMTMDNFDEIPILDASSIKTLLISNCPIPLNTSLNYFVNNWNFTKLEHFKFYSNGSNVGRTIESNIFEGMENISSITFTSYDENIKFSSEIITIPCNVTIILKQLKFQVVMAPRMLVLDCTMDLGTTSIPNMRVLENNVSNLGIYQCNVKKDSSLNSIVQKLNLKKIENLFLIDVNMDTNYFAENFQQLEYLKGLNIQNSASQYFSLNFIKHLLLKIIRFKNVNLNSNDFRKFHHLDYLQITNSGIVITIITNLNTIIVDCTESVFKNLDELPHIKLDNSTNLFIKECSLPYNKSLIIFKEIFSINQILQLDIKSKYANEGREFTSKLFEGLNEVQKLSFNSEDIHEIPDDLFKHLKKLNEIELYFLPNLTIPQDIFAFNHELKTISIQKEDLSLLLRRKLLKIVCSRKLTIDSNWLPKYDEIIIKIIITDCETPKNKSLQQIFQGLKLKHVKILKVDCLLIHEHTPYYDVNFFQDFKSLESLAVGCPGVEFAQDDLKHLQSLNQLKWNIKNIKAPENISSMAPSLKTLEIYTDLIYIIILLNQIKFDVKVICKCETDDYIKDIPTLIIEDDVNLLSVYECSLPHNNSMAIFKKKFNIKNLSNVGIGSGNVNKHRTLSSEHFEGFENIKGLMIIMIVMNSTDDAFKYLHDLELLEIIGNIVPTSRSSIEKIRNFSLKRSNLSTIPRFFLKSESLHKLEITDNKVALEAIDENLFLDFPNVETLTIKNNFLKIIQKDTFKGCSKLSIVDLSLNRIEVLPKNIFENQNLQKLDLSGNLIFELDDDVFRSMTSLEILRLSNNKLRKIQDSLFSKNTHLAELYLEHNEIVSINRKVFRGKFELKTINITNNKLIFFDTSSIENLAFLSKLDLRENRINHFDFNIKRRYVMRNLDVNLQNNDIRVVNVNLQNNDIRIVNVNNYFDFNDNNTITFYVENNPFVCDCHAADFVDYLQRKAKVIESINETIIILPQESSCFKPDYMKGRFMRDVRPIDLLCDLEYSEIEENNCPDDCRCIVRAADFTLIVNCSSLNLIEIPRLPNITNIKLKHIELYVDNNNITKLPFLSFPFYNAVSKLIAFNNDISDLQLENIPISLQVLELKNNNLTFFETNVVNVLKYIRKLSLSENDWTCECSSIDFLSFVKEYRANITDFNHLKCFDGQMMDELDTTDLCFNYLFLAVILTIISTIIGVFAAIYYRFKKEIKIWLFAHDCCLWWVSEEELDREMIYDAFIVFATPDQSMVEDLVLGLENCENPYKCCVHIRDWPPGEMIVTQVHNSIRDSRRTIVILSPHFHESRWARFELRVALLNAFDEKRSRVIIVLNGELDDIEEMDEDLELYLKLNTYIKWSDYWFWSKLKYALPHKKALEVIKDEQGDKEIELQNTHLQI